MMRVKKKKECRGRGANSKWGVQKKRKKGRRRAWAWFAIGFGPVRPMNFGSVQKEPDRFG